MIVALFLFSSLARAVAPPPCSAFAQLNKKMNSCADNFDLGKYVVKCMHRYTEEVKSRQSKIKDLLVKHAAAAHMDKGKSEHKNTASAYAELQQELDALIATGMVARIAVNSFLDELYFPEDYDKPQFIGMSTDQYLKTEPCFAVPRSVIMGATDTFTKVVADLGKAKESAKRLAATSGDFSGKATSATTDPMVDAPKNAAPSAKGADASSSTITDTTRKPAPPK